MRLFRTVGKDIVTILLLSVFLLAPLALPTHRAEANLTDDAKAGAAGCAAAAAIVWALSQIPALGVPTLNANDWKESLLDCAGWVIDNIIIAEITQSTIEWINSGFDGNPGFIENYPENNQRVFDQAAASFIHSQELDFICEPFRLNIRLALIDSVGGAGNNFYTRNQCTISRFTDNIQGFLDGDFYSGGWGAWFELTTRPQNNPYGAYLIAQGELARRTGAALEEENKKLDWANGYRPKEKCEIVGYTDTNGDGFLEDGVDAPIQNCRIITPGSTVEDSLNNAIQLGNERLTVADEFNEILATLLTYLFTELLTGDGGLRDFDESNIPTVPPIDYDDVIGGVADGAGANDVFYCPTGGVPGGSVINQNYFTDNQLVFPPSGGNKFTAGEVKPGIQGHYGRMELDFDFFLNEFDSTSPFQGIFVFRNRALPDAQNNGCFAQLIIRPDGTNFTFCGSGTKPQFMRNTTWVENTNYHIRIVRDADPENPIGELVVTNTDTGQNIVSFNTPLPKQAVFKLGSGATTFFFGGEFLPDGVKRLEGSSVSNVHVRFVPSEPICNANPIAGGPDEPPTTTP